MKEYGTLRRTLYAVRYLSDESYRRRIGRQLNKGENLHSLRRALAYAHEGALRRRHHDQQAEQMWCLTLATNAIVCWMSEYHGLAVTALRTRGRRINDEVLAHIWPATTKTSTSTARTPSTLRPSWPPSTPPAIGRCGCPRHRSPHRHSLPVARPHADRLAAHAD
jgi:Tn3 transposase DDE domain